MNSLTIKHKEFEIVEIYKTNIYKCSYKNKFYIVTKLNINDVNYKENLLMISKLTHSSVKQPKLFLIDKKQGFIVREYLDGVTLFDYILDFKSIV